MAAHTLRWVWTELGWPPLCLCRLGPGLAGAGGGRSIGAALHKSPETTVAADIRREPPRSDAPPTCSTERPTSGRGATYRTPQFGFHGDGAAVYITAVFTRGGGVASVWRCLGWTSGTRPSGDDGVLHTGVFTPDGRDGETRVSSFQTLPRGP